MIIYLVEFAILHTLFLLVYKVLLARETQLRFLRFFLVGTTVLSLIIPLIEIPSFGSIPTVNLAGIVFSTGQIPASAQPEELNISVYQFLFIVISSIFLLILIYGLFQISRLYKDSRLDISFRFPIRKVDGIKNSFTFLRWIFIDPAHFENPEEIITHESGHSTQLHSLDILLFNILKVPFWCVPSIWIMIYELRKVHEFEADQFALRSTDQNNYIKTLVHCTLKAHGLNLASSFDDAPTVQRLKFMKKMKKKISPWKVGSIIAIVLISGAMFACQEELDAEVQRIVEESNQQVFYTDEVQAALADLNREYPDQEFVVIETQLENEESIRKLSEYDPDQIKHIFVNKEEDHKSIVMIVSEDSELFSKATEMHESQYDDKVHTIVEEPARFIGGLEAFYGYLKTEMEYPEEAQKKGIEGRVFVQFTVETDGSLSDIHVVKGIDPDCDGEAVRVLENSPKWIPGSQDGKTVRMKMVQNILFQL